MQTLIDRIQEALIADTFKRKKYSQNLVEYFDAANDREKILIDLCFVSLCGRSLSAFIAVDQTTQENQATLTV